MPELSSGAACSPRSWEKHQLVAVGRAETTLPLARSHHTTRTGKRSPCSGVSRCPQHQPRQLRDGAGMGEQTTAQRARGAPAGACAMAVCVSASLGQHDLIKSPHWAPSLPNFPSLALLTMALKVEMKWCPPEWGPGLITCSPSKLGRVCAKGESTHGRCSSSLPNLVPFFRQWCLYATITWCQT